MTNTVRARRLLLASTVSLLATTAAQASDMPRPEGVEDSNFIVVRNDLDPNALPPGGVLDSGVTGIGQMTIRGNPATTGRGLCTGTLINPRTVIFAAHCVNTRPANAYGAANGAEFGAWTGVGGTPISFGFEANNLPAVRQWLGLESAPGAGDANPALRHATNEARFLYNVEQVFWDPRSLTPGGNGFLIGDIAIATLDTPAFDVPTWAMLFSPLDGPANVRKVGYGASGREQDLGSAPGNPAASQLPLDSRRRSVENVVSALYSLVDRNNFLFGPGVTNPNLANNVYMASFSNPLGVGFGFDFGIFGGASTGDVARPREGTTSGGDSGGPLLVSGKYDREVIAGVLSGGSRFFGAQYFWNYGSHSIYQPLFLYWETIVRENPYVYASAKAGNGAWEDPTRWVQLMDPTYMIDVGGSLVNGLPDTPEQGIAGGGAKFGKICFLNDCQDLTQAGPTGNGTPIFVEGGPGSTNFVPNNVVANPRLGIKARYYDITLSEAGTTTLSSAVTIDKLDISGARTKLAVGSAGSLRVNGEYTQYQGWTEVNGLIQSRRDMAFLSGLVSGSGTLRAPWVTVGLANVAPAGADTIGTLTVDGNMILSSGASLFVDANRFGADKLVVTGSLDINGSALVMNKAQGAAPRHGDSFQIATAGTLTGAFGQIYSFQGVLRPELAYSGTAVTATLRAGSLANQIGQSGPIERAFAQALDTLRAGSYGALYNLYGSIDLMGSAQLASTLRGLAPVGVADSLEMHDRQSRLLLTSISDRLSMMGRSGSQSFDVIGAPHALALTLATEGGENVRANQLGLTHGLVPGAGAKLGNLPEGMSGFISGGFNEVAAAGSAFGGEERMAHMAVGLEMEVADGLTIGTAVAHAEGFTDAVGNAADRARTRMSQAAFYGSYRLGGGAYVAGLAAAETGVADTRRSVGTGDRVLDLVGATSTQRLTLMAETGVAFGVVDGLEVTPKAQLAWSQNRYGGLSERGGDAALALDSLQLERVEARLGVAATGSIDVARGWALRPQLQAQAVRLLAGADSGMTVRFAAARDVAIGLPLLNGDSSWAEVRSGLNLTNGRLSFGAGVESSIGRADLRDSRAVAEFGFRF